MTETSSRGQDRVRIRYGMSGSRYKRAGDEALSIERIHQEPCAELSRSSENDLDLLLQVLPSAVRQTIEDHPKRDDLLEVVLDLGRVPEARFPGEVVDLTTQPVQVEELEHVVERIGELGGDNRAGIERTLHRISAIRNRTGKIVGLTCRVGRAVYGTLDIVRDVIESGKSLLLLGRPGVGKTTLLREAARVLAVELGKRVVVVDTSNEIAGDGDIPHPGIGRARRMQVPSPEAQHQVMLEAVENHMPEVIVIDEIGTAAEVLASRTIAERGVQLIATAHGNHLESLLRNPVLSGLIGGIHSVILSDEEARRRGTQKTVLERKGPPAFDVVIEILERDHLVVHDDISEVIDRYLRGFEPRPEVRIRRDDGEIEIETGAEALADEPTETTTRPKAAARSPWRPDHPPTLRGWKRTLRIFPYAVSRNKLERAIRELGVAATVVRHLQEADLILTLKSQDRRQPKRLRDAEMDGVRLELIKSNTVTQIESFLRVDFQVEDIPDEEDLALRQAEEAVIEVFETGQPVELAPRSANLRRLQHELVDHFGGTSSSRGQEPNRRVVVSPS